MVTFKPVQTICIANVCQVAEDGRIRVEIGITLDVGFLTQCLNWRRLTALPNLETCNVLSGQPVRTILSIDHEVLLRYGS